MKTGSVILSRLLPKTGQVTSYRTGDDGYYEAGWWMGLTVANNKTRFIAKTIDGDDVVIDNATGLMWSADGTAAGGNDGNVINWNGAIDYCNALDFAGFTDWRLPNAKELLSLIDYGMAAPYLPADFINITADVHWTSTALFGSDTAIWSIDLSTGMMDKYANKVETHYLISVRGGV